MAGRTNRRQEEVIEYLKQDNQVLREHVGRKWLLLNNEQKRRLGRPARTIV